MRTGRQRIERVRPAWRVAAALALGFSVPALSANTAGVFSPDVDAGTRSLTWRGAYTASENGLPGVYTQRFHYDHALDGRWRLRLVAAQRRLDGGAFDYRGTRVEALWQFREHETDGWDAALRFDVEAGDEGTDLLRLGWSGQRALGTRWGLRANVLLTREISGRTAGGVRVETRAAVSFAPGAAWRIAVEAYNNYNTTASPGGFDDQRHQLGPLATWRFGAGWRLHAGFLVGLSSTADDLNWRLALDRAF